MKSFSKAFGRIVLILTVVIALVASVFVVPKLFGINPYVVISVTMPSGSSGFSSRLVSLWLQEVLE